MYTKWQYLKVACEKLNFYLINPRATNKNLLKEGKVKVMSRAESNEIIKILNWSKTRHYKKRKWAKRRWKK